MLKPNIVVFIVFVSQITANETETQKKIEALEKEKNYLFLKINDAIDKNINAFKTINETEAILAVNYLKNLKEQIQEFNQTNGEEFHEATDTEVISVNDTNFRRKEKPKTKEDFVKHMEKILKPKDISPKKLKEILDTRDRVKVKLGEWIEERKKEKEKIRKYRMEMKYLQRMGAIEKCPRFGFGTKKKFDKSDYAACKKRYKEKYEKKCFADQQKEEDRPLKTRKRAHKLYPCCRKCCKKSYMGCL